MSLPAGTAVPAATSRDGTWAALSADLVHAGRSCAPRTESDPQGDPGMTLCVYLGLESNKPETQLVRRKWDTPLRSNTRKKYFTPCLEYSSAEQPLATAGFAQAPPYNG